MSDLSICYTSCRVAISEKISDGNNQVVRFWLEDIVRFNSTYMYDRLSRSSKKWYALFPSTVYHLKH